MRRSLWTCALVLLALAVVGWGPDGSKRIADYDKVVAGMDRLVLLPPSFTVEKAGTFSAETQSAMSHDIILCLHDAVERIITESRFKLGDLDVSDSALAADSELRQHLGENTTAIEAAFARIVATKGAILDVDFGGDLDYFADASGADYLLVVGGGGWFKTGGTRTMDFLLPGEPGAGSTTMLRAMLVDATRGKVIWYNEVTQEDKDPRKPSQLQQSAQALMQPLTGKSRLKADKTHDADIIDKYKAMEKPKAAGK